MELELFMQVFSKLFTDFTSSNFSATVHMPGLTWDDSCAKTSGGRKVKCLKWQPDKVRCMDVACLVACEAKRAGKQGNAFLSRREARVSVPFVINKLRNRSWNMEARSGQNNFFYCSSCIYFNSQLELFLSVVCNKFIKN